MTTIERTVTENVEETKTVTVCDMCGLDETILPDDEDIHRITIGETGYEVTYHLDIEYHGSKKGEEKEFESKEDAEDYLDEADNVYSVDKKTILQPYAEHNLDVCDHCLETFLSAWEEGESTKWVLP